MINKLKNKIYEGKEITKEEAMAIALFEDKKQVYKLAGDIRKKFAGNIFDTCSIINARSGRCSEDCKWCSQSSMFKTNVETYEMIDEKMCMEMAGRNAKYGIDKFSFVTSGRSLSNRNIDMICRYAVKIGNKYPINLCASMGLMTKEKLQKLMNVGIKRYHCNLESSRRFFPQVCSSHSYDEKIATLKAAMEIGMEVCSGGIIGMGENMEDRIDLALELRKLGVKSIPINVLNPIKGTALEDRERLSDDDILMSIAIFRFINPDSYLRLAGGRILIEHLEEQAMEAGINAAIFGDMLTTSGPKVKKDFETINKMGFDLK